MFVMSDGVYDENRHTHFNERRGDSDQRIKVLGCGPEKVEHPSDAESEQRSCKDRVVTKW